MSGPTVLRVVFAGFLAAGAAGLTGCRENGTGIRVTRFAFHGTKAVKESQLKSVLATGASSKLPWGQKRYFSREQFEADMKRIVAFYRDRGYPDARVTSFNAKLSQDQESVALDVNIDEGRPLTVQKVSLEGFDVLPDEHRYNLDTKLPLKAGQPLDRALLQASREAALDELRDHGYAYASVRLSEAPGGSDHEHVVSLVADPGPLTQVGPIEISGNSSVGDNVVRRQLTYKPGELYQQSKLRESQRKLYQLELFNFVNIEPLHTDRQVTEVPTRVTVTEGKHRKINFGVGYGSEERARAQVDWRHVNFFGGARTAGVEARYSALDRGVKLNFKEPYLLSPRFSFSATGQTWHTSEPAFTLDTNGGRFTITREFARAGGPVLNAHPATTLAFTYQNEREDYTISKEILADLSQRDELISLGLDPTGLGGRDPGRGGGQLSAMSLDAGRNTTDNLLDAKHGYIASLHLQQAGRWLRGSYDYYEVTGEGRYYLPIADRAVVAVKVTAGSIDAFGPELKVVPFFKRYFLGGATSLRGWGRFDVAPLSGSGLPIGGLSFASFSTELRAPIWSQLSGVLFLDGGNVWMSPWDINPNDLHYDVGPGLRYKTPIGPIRLDIGYQLNRIPGLLVNGKPETRRFRVHFSIGQAF
jgi:outer membrane protein insertion porin family/translocation and assembly module TamA